MFSSITNPKFHLRLTVLSQKEEDERFASCYLKYIVNSIQLFIFTNVIHCSRLRLWVGYFIYFKFTPVSSIVYQSLHLDFS